MQFGYGQLTGIDLDGEHAGLLPSTAWKREAYRRPEQQRWYAGETISLGIGQGYNAFTPLQIAHAVATLADNGVAMKPHLVMAIENGVTHERTEIAPVETNRIPLKQENIDVVKNAMVGVTKEGTSSRIFANAAYVSAGKTGTAQVVGIKKNEKYDAKNVAERMRDNALYIAYAPADKPKIAIAIVVENGGFGAEAAAPIVKKALDYYLLGKLPEDKDNKSNKDKAPDGRPLPPQAAAKVTKAAVAAVQVASQERKPQ